MPDPTERWARVSALFDELVELTSPERVRRLRDLAQRDAALAAELATLLDADESTSALLDDGIAAALPELLDDPPPVDRRAGPYRLLRPIGQGGMGVVWLAERTDGAYDQQVAVKLLKRGMDTHALLRRFLQERRILARLHHAHIVRLVDGGMSADGRPFYVMDLVDGLPVTAHATAGRLDVRSRVRLLVQVADAVAYAHAQLVVHRDLKPSNVLVDRAGEPRVLDFGIARLLEDSSEQACTSTGLRVLSPAYAAPEQILGEPIGTATDVYALGVMLCELLVGQLPQHRRNTTPAQLAQDAVHETVERVSALAARLPPARISELYGSAALPAELSRHGVGDIDVIAATALQREPQRRYQTAAAFAEDLRRWLDGRPISARADSGRYRLAKFVRRHRVGVAAGVLIALSLLAGLGAALWQAGIARAQAQRADAERAQAEHQLARAERVKDFILTLFREQDPVSRASAQARTSVELIRGGIAQTEATLAAEPALQAELLRDLGEIQAGLDDRTAAEATLKRAFELQTKLTGAGSVASAEALAAYADAVYAVGDVEKSAAMLRDAVAQLRAAGHAERPKTAQAESTLAMIAVVHGQSDEAERLVRHAIEVARAAYGAGDSRVAMRLTALGKVQQEGGHYPEALASYGEALEIVARNDGKEHVRTATLRASIGDVLRLQRKYDDALEHYEAAVRIERATLPPAHVILGGTLMRLGDLQRRSGRFDAADGSFTEAIAILAKTPSGQYAQVLQLHGNLARAQGRFDTAIDRYRQSFEVFRSATGDSVYTWLTALLRVSLLTDLGRLAEAEALADESAPALARLSAEDSYNTMYSASVIGALRHAQRREDEAIPLLRDALRLVAATYGEDHAEVAQSRVALAASLIASGDAGSRGEAASLIETAKSALERGGDAGSEPMLGAAYLERGRLRHDSGDHDGARADLVQAMQRLQSPEHAPRLREARKLAQQWGVRA